MMNELIGYTSEANGYYVDDYPYGRTVRCRIRYWLETDEKKGVRFCSQTENPKTLRWNNPKRSTYAKVAGAMYLDAAGHVQWRNVTEYTDEHAALAFAQDFPLTIAGDKQKSLLVWASMKARYYRKFAAGEIGMTVNGVRKETTPNEIEEYSREADVWERVARTIKGEAS